MGFDPKETIEMADEHGNTVHVRPDDVKNFKANGYEVVEKETDEKPKGKKAK